jgi:hypothetical protein
MGVAFLVIAFGVFALTSRPHDDLAGLKPYITGDRVSFVTRHSLTGRDEKILRRTVLVQGLEYGQARELERRAPGRSHGFSHTFKNVDDLSDMLRMDHAQVSQITYWEELKWNEVLWVRVTHLGRDPFPPVNR